MAEPYDLVIIGGGTNGPALMVTALLSGFKRVALIERGAVGRGRDGHAANAASTGMVQPGLKYLKSDLSVVSTDAYDCRLLRIVAGDLLRRRKFLLPVYADYRFPYQYAWLWDIYLNAYDTYSSLALHEPHRLLSADETREREPMLVGPLSACIEYDEWVTDPVLLARAFMSAARERGGSVYEHAEVVGFETEDRRGGRHVRSVIIREEDDRESLVPARYVINAAGAWAPGVGRILGLDIHMRPTLGTSIEVRGRLVDHPLVLFDQAKRYITVMPWEETTVIGPTNVDVPDEVRDDPDLARPCQEEVDALLDIVNRYLSVSLDREDIRRLKWGLRPQLNHRLVKPYDITHRFAVYDHRRDGVVNACTLIGGKLSSQLRMAKEAVALACERLEHPFVWGIPELRLNDGAGAAVVSPRWYRRRCGLRLRCDARQDSVPGRASRRQRIRAVGNLSRYALGYALSFGRRRT